MTPYPRKWVAGTLPSDNDANDQKTGPGRESRLATLLPALVQPYNTTRSPVSRYSQHFLMFGQQPKIPINIHIPTVREKRVTTFKMNNYISGLKKPLKCSFTIAQQYTEAKAA